MDKNQAHPNLSFTPWLEAIQDELGIELRGEDYLVAVRWYSEGLPWPQVARRFIPSRED